MGDYAYGFAGDRSGGGSRHRPDPRGPELVVRRRAVAVEPRRCAGGDPRGRDAWAADGRRAGRGGDRGRGRRLAPPRPPRRPRSWSNTPPGSPRSRPPAGPDGPGPTPTPTVRPSSKPVASGPASPLGSAGRSPTRGCGRSSEIDEQLARLAARDSYRRFDARLTDWIRQVDEDGTRDANQRHHDNRDATIRQDYDGSWTIAGGCASMDGAVLHDILEHFVAAEFQADWDKARAEHGDAATLDDLPRTPGQRRFDALYQLFQRAAAPKPT
ncbi:MAG: DUF222 domain-containing protein [Acidimicrobiales bacterium]